MKNLISKVFLWMSLGLIVTFATGYLITLNPRIINAIFGNLGYLGCIIFEIVLIFILSYRLFRMKPNTAKATFLLYSFVNGLTFSSIFITYNLKSILLVFLITAIIYGLLALFGYKTKLNLEKPWPYLMFSLIGIIIVSIINLFLHNSKLEIIISIVSIIIFMLITAYDVKKIKELSKNNLPKENLAIYGALELYLDFINIFINLLRIKGNDD